MGILSNCRNNIYIICTILSLLFNECLYGLNYNQAFEEINIAGDTFSRHILIHKLISYLGTFLLALLVNRIEVFCTRSKSLIEISKIDKEKEAKRKGNEIKLIYVDSQSDINKFKTTKFCLYYFLIIVIWIIEDQLIESYYLIFKDLDFWMIELFIICCLNSRVFKVQIYNHQILAIIFSLFSSLLKIVTIVLSFIEEELINDKDKKKYEGNLPIFYISGSKYKIPLGFFLYLILIILRSIVNLTLKWYMDKKFISHTKILMVYGLIGTLLYSIICTITTFQECKEIDKNIEFFNYICKVNNTDNKLYLENFCPFFKNLEDSKEKLRKALVIISGIFSFFFNKYFRILVIKYLSPVHVIFSFPIIFILEKILLIINTIINCEQRHFRIFKEDNKYKYWKFFLDISGDIVSLIGFLIYLEIITLNCRIFNYIKKT